MAPCISVQIECCDVTVIQDMSWREKFQTLWKSGWSHVLHWIFASSVIIRKLIAISSFGHLAAGRHMCNFFLSSLSMKVLSGYPSNDPWSAYCKAIASGIMDAVKEAVEWLAYLWMICDQKHSLLLVLTTMGWALWCSNATSTVCLWREDTVQPKNG